MLFTYEVDDTIVTVCETQVENLIVDLTHECKQRVGILTQKASEEAQRKLAASGSIDPVQLVIDAGMKPLKAPEEEA